MDDILEETQTKANGFVQHVFNFDTATKSELMNIAQYSILAIIPIVFLNKLIQNYVPDVDEEKGSLEILIEVFGQVFLLFFAMFFIHRLITFIPSYSGKPYNGVNILGTVLSFLVIVLSLQTKLGEKVEILSNRVIELWTGPPKADPKNERKHREGENVVHVRQPITGRGPHPPIPTHQPSQADNVNYNYSVAQMQQNSIHQNNQPRQSMDMSPPPMQPGTQMPPTQVPLNQPNFDGMFQEPMAANEGFSSFGGSTW